MFHIYITAEDVELSLRYFCSKCTLPYEFCLQVLLSKSGYYYSHSKISENSFMTKWEGYNLDIKTGVVWEKEITG